MRKITFTGTTLSSSSNGDSIDLKEQLHSVSSLVEATTIVIKAIIQQLLDKFKIPVAEVDKSMPLAKYGVDSLVTVELRNWIIAHSQTEIYRGQSFGGSIPIGKKVILGSGFDSPVSLIFYSLEIMVKAASISFLVKNLLGYMVCPSPKET